MSNNILEQEKEVTIRIPVRDYLFASDMGKYLYVQGVGAGPTIEDFTKQAFYFYINSMGKHLGQAPVNQPVQQPVQQFQPVRQPEQVRIQVPPETDVRVQVQQPQTQPVQTTLFEPQAIQEQQQEENELDMSIDEMFEKTMSSNMEEELARIRRFSGAGQNIANTGISGTRGV